MKRKRENGEEIMADFIYCCYEGKTAILKWRWWLWWAKEIKRSAFWSHSYSYRLLESDPPPRVSHSLQIHIHTYALASSHLCGKTTRHTKTPNSFNGPDTLRAPVWPALRGSVVVVFAGAMKASTFPQCITRPDLSELLAEQKTCFRIGWWSTSADSNVAFLILLM